MSEKELSLLLPTFVAPIRTHFESLARDVAEGKPMKKEVSPPASATPAEQALARIIERANPNLPEMSRRLDERESELARLGELCRKLAGS
jgi:hypothetical protein